MKFGKKTVKNSNTNGFLAKNPTAMEIFEDVKSVDGDFKVATLESLANAGFKNIDISNMKISVTKTADSERVSKAMASFNPAIKQQEEDGKIVSLVPSFAFNLDGQDLFVPLSKKLNESLAKYGEGALQTEDGDDKVAVYAFTTTEGHPCMRVAAIGTGISYLREEYSYETVKADRS